MRSDGTKELAARKEASSDETAGRAVGKNGGMCFFDSHTGFALLAFQTRKLETTYH